MSAGSLWNVATRAYMSPPGSPDVPPLIVAPSDGDRRGLPVMFTAPQALGTPAWTARLGSARWPWGMARVRIGRRPPWGMGAGLTLPERPATRRLKGLE